MQSKKKWNEKNYDDDDDEDDDEISSEYQKEKYEWINHRKKMRSESGKKFKLNIK